MTQLPTTPTPDDLGPPPPEDSPPPRARPGAYWAMLGPDVELRRTEYDVDEAVARYRATDDPAVEAIVEMMLTPPEPREVIDHAEQVVFSG